MTKNKKNQKVTIIEAYLQGKLKGEALSNFEARLNSDPGFAAEVDFHRDLHGAIRGAEKKKAFRNMVKTEEMRYKAAKKGIVKILTPRFIRFAMAIAAMAVLLFGAWWWNIEVGEMSGPELFAQYFEAPVLLAKDRSTTFTATASLMEAYDAYEADDFEQANILFEQAMIEEEQKPVVYYYAGISELAVNEPDRAILYLEKVILEGNSAFVAGAQWFKALALLKLQNKEEAKLELKALIGKGAGKYKTKAKKLLKKMED